MTNEIYENVALGDLLLSERRFEIQERYSDKITGETYLGTDLLVSNLFLITKGDGIFREEMLYTESGKKINLDRLNKGILKSEVFEFRG